MELRKRMEITVETDEVVTVRRAKVYRAWCAECAREVDMVAVTDAWAIVGVPKTVPTRSVKWHVYEQQETALVCMESLMKSM
jgi:hypothetical protein